MPSRASAVREIMRRGLAAEGNVGTHSETYGVVETPTPDKESRVRKAARLKQHFLNALLLALVVLATGKRGQWHFG